MRKAKPPRNADHVRRKNAPAPGNEVIEERLTSLLTPAILGQQGYTRLLGLRERILSFPVLVAAVLTLLWRQVPSVCELSRTLAREDCLWAPKLKVSQQALSQRLLSFPAELFQRVLLALLPRLQRCWAERQRPLPAAVERARTHFGEAVVVRVLVASNRSEAVILMVDKIPSAAALSRSFPAGLLLDRAYASGGRLP